MMQRDDIEVIGPILHLQVQPTSVKVKGLRERYEPAVLQPVETLLVEPEGVTGITAQGERLMDVHHRDHPQSRLRRGNGLSLCFSSHYQAMQSYFGPHVGEGCAGENILVQASTLYLFERVQAGFVVYHAATEEWAEFGSVRVATPCVLFARYALNKRLFAPSAQQMKAALQMLDQGRRGFYATLEEQSGPSYRVHRGDLLCVKRGSST